MTNSGNIPDSERWLPLVGFEGSYLISDQGRARSLPRTVIDENGTLRQLKGKMLTCGIGANGYPRFVAFKKGKRLTVKVHVAVMAAFVGPRPKGQEVRHLNGVCSESNLKNLEYGTHVENMADMMAHGRWKSPARVAPKLGRAAVLEIRARVLEPTSILASKFNVATQTIRMVQRGKLLAHLVD